MQQQQIQKQNQAALNQEQELKLKQQQQDILNNMYQINQQSANSLLTLHNQGEKIDRIEQNLDQNQQKLHKIDYILDVIKSPWGQFKALFTKPKQEKLEQKEKNNQQQQIQQPPQRQVDEIYDEMINQTNQMKYQQLLTNQVLKNQNTQLDKINQKADNQTVQMAKQNEKTKKIIK
ncbi:unnamed protein product [Paramecium pentaurelia]|uniref:t-SNARE coiled-coil homology domain-containing protein n=1 Tax=Paramecium pentaurelia TaxID=43138 RepID=A0A8S1UMB4_9CILI|nr:unnamed protein product [Paramecium pentaurelia]